MPPDYTVIQKLGFCFEHVTAKDMQNLYVFTPWERDFLSSVHQQFLIRDSISSKQGAIVLKCFPKLVAALPELFEDDDNPALLTPTKELPAHLQRNPKDSYSQEAPISFDEPRPFDDAPPFDDVPF